MFLPSSYPWLEFVWHLTEGGEEACLPESPASPSCSQSIRGSLHSAGVAPQRTRPVLCISQISRESEYTRYALDRLHSASSQPEKCHSRRQCNLQLGPSPVATEAPRAWRCRRRPGADCVRRHGAGKTQDLRGRRSVKLKVGRETCGERCHCCGGGGGG